MKHALILVLAGLAKPAFADGDAAFGKELYGSLCIRCHHEDAKGDDRAPDIRGAPVPAIRRGTSGMDSMPDFHLADEDIADIHAYLQSFAD